MEMMKKLYFYDAENIRGNEYTFTAEGVRMDSDNNA